MNSSNLFSHNISFEIFEKLSNCNGLPMYADGKKINACVSSWALWAEKNEKQKDIKSKKRNDNSWQHYMNTLLNGKTLDSHAFDEFLRPKLVSNVVFITLNASAPAKVDNLIENEFFHSQSSGDQRFRKMFHEWEFPFEGAYITDIIKVENGQKHEILINSSSEKVEKAINGGTIDVYTNYKILLDELNILRSGANEPVFLIPLGEVAYWQTQEFINWLQQYDEFKNAYISASCRVDHYSAQGDVSKERWVPAFEKVEKDFLEKFSVK